MECRGPGVLWSWRSAQHEYNTPVVVHLAMHATHLTPCPLQRMWSVAPPTRPEPQIIRNKSATRTVQQSGDHFGHGKRSIWIVQPLFHNACLSVFCGAYTNHRYAVALKSCVAYFSELERAVAGAPQGPVYQMTAMPAH